MSQATIPYPASSSHGSAQTQSSLTGNGTSTDGPGLRDESGCGTACRSLFGLFIAYTVFAIAFYVYMTRDKMDRSNYYDSKEAEEEAMTRDPYAEWIRVNCERQKYNKKKMKTERPKKGKSRKNKISPLDESHINNNDHDSGLTAGSSSSLDTMSLSSLSDSHGEESETRGHR